jgi:DNA polymerase I-like protein with 3'-5' exonuclease and polymerase domains
MKFKGVRVDIERANKLKQQLLSQEQGILAEIKKLTGIEPQIWAARSISKVFDNLDLKYPVTEKSSAPSFTKNFLQEHSHPIVQMIAKAREINKAHTTFIDTILRFEYKGRIHADINPIRSDVGGTVTGRFSYSNPNLQQIPARNKELGPMIRSLFLPEEDHKWGCFDYSQQEPRMVVHYAATDPAIKDSLSVKEIVDNYKKHDLDFHDAVAKMANIERSSAKVINLGLFYGMGKAKLQAELGLSSKEEAEDLFDKYHTNVPFVKMLSQQLSKAALENGSIKTLLGRRCRFNKWEFDEYRAGKMGDIFDSKEQAVEAYVKRCMEQWKEMSEEKIEYLKKNPKIRRAFTYKAMNKLIQ